METLGRILPYLFQLLMALSIPWLPWLVATSLPSLPLYSHHFFLHFCLLPSISYKDSLLDLRLTCVIQDTLISRFLITSAKTFSPTQTKSQSQFSGTKTLFFEVTIQPTTGTICLITGMSIVICQSTLCLCIEQYRGYMNHGHI